MKSYLFSVLLLLTCVGTGFSQNPHSIEFNASGMPPTILVGSTTGGTYTFPDGGGTILSQLDGQPTVSKAWLLGGNTSSAPFNQLGTLDATDLTLISGGAPRMTVFSGGNVGIGASSQFLVNGATGNLLTINGVTNYAWPASHEAGFLQNDGSGNLTWANSVQASRAGLGSYAVGNINNFAAANISVAGGFGVTTIIPAFNGSVTGLSVVTSAAISGGGTLTATVIVNGAVTVATVNMVAGQTFGFIAIPAGNIPFNAGQTVQVNLTANGIGPGRDVLATVFATF